MASHDAEGAMGFVINRPTGQLLAEIAPDVEPLKSLGHVPVFSGGPVGTDQILIAALRIASNQHGVPVFLPALRESPEALAQLDGYPGISVRAFVGYAGWTGGQVEKEIGENSWIIAPPGAELLDAEQCADAWRTVLLSLGPYYRILAQAPDDIYRN